MKLIIFLILSTFVNLSYAGYPPMPDQCPDVKSIQKAGIDYGELIKFTESEWNVYHPFDHYNTHDTWSFAIRSINAFTEQDAMQWGNDELQSLRLKYGPEEVMDGHHWICVYTTKNYTAATITPAYID